ncbi:Glycosyltransferase AglD [uncultured archaeon]|nr:Glycosyltransferase AglD [uncultured archaeon]
MPHISVVIPVYKAEDSLHELYRRLKESLETTTKDFEIILVEDCGGDRSWDIIAELAELDNRVKGIQFSRNFGQHASTICGISKANGDWIVTIDDDLEHMPEDIPAMYAKAQEGYDLVYGIYNQRTHSKWRNITSDIARKLFRIAIPNLNHEYTSLRIIKKNIAMSLTKFDSPFPFIDGYLSWVTNNYSTITVNHGIRKYGNSNYNLRKLLVHTINIFITFSDLPLKIAIWMGLFSFMIGSFWLLIILIEKFFGIITVMGYTSIMAAIIAFGGLQMLILGILGIYLGRINFKTSRKPLFVISEEIDLKRNNLI